MQNGEVVEQIEHFTYLGSKALTSVDREEFQPLISKASESEEIQQLRADNKDPILRQQSRSLLYGEKS